MNLFSDTLILLIKHKADTATRPAPHCRRRLSPGQILSETVSVRDSDIGLCATAELPINNHL